jgi:hypothetical protein
MLERGNRGSIVDRSGEFLSSPVSRLKAPSAQPLIQGYRKISLSGLGTRSMKPTTHVKLQLEGDLMTPGLACVWCSNSQLRLKKLTLSSDQLRTSTCKTASAARTTVLLEQHSQIKYMTGNAFGFMPMLFRGGQRRRHYLSTLYWDSQGWTLIRGITKSRLRCSFEVNNSWICTYTSPYFHMTRCLIRHSDNLNFLPFTAARHRTQTGKTFE